MSSAFNPIRAALLVMLHEARRFNAATMREAGIGPFDLVAVRQAEAALAAPAPPVDAVPGEPVARPDGAGYFKRNAKGLWEQVNSGDWVLPGVVPLFLAPKLIARPRAASVAVPGEPVAWAKWFQGQLSLVPYSTFIAADALSLGWAPLSYSLAASVASRAGSEPVASEGLPLAQEPKYTVNGSAIVNRASGEAIPADEPVFIFRARDKHAVEVLERYAAIFGWSATREHYEAVVARIVNFRNFAHAHPERMKEPDTDRGSAGEAQS